MKPVKASLHTAPAVLHALRERKVLHAVYPRFIFFLLPCQMKHCVAVAPQYEAFANANVKHKRLKPLV